MALLRREFTRIAKELVDLGAMLRDGNHCEHLRISWNMRPLMNYLATSRQDSLVIQAAKIYRSIRVSKEDVCSPDNLTRPYLERKATLAHYLHTYRKRQDVKKTS